MTAETDPLLADLLVAPVAKVSFSKWFAEQSETRRKALEAAAVNPEWTSYGLLGVVKKYGAPCSSGAIKQWRRDLGYVE